MKYLLTILISGCIFLSCTKDVYKPSQVIAESQPLSQWTLMATYLDPGDGSGEFMPYSGPVKVLDFINANTLQTNYTLCQMFSNNNSGTFVSSYDGLNIYPENCNTNFDYSIRYEINGNELLLHYMCFEGCVERYERKN